MNPNLLNYFLIPLMIFVSRILDQSLGSIRIIFVAKGMKYIAPIIGFFEVLIWLIIMTYIMKNLNHYLNFIAYAGGFAMGNYVGILIEEKIAIGLSLIRVIPQKDSHNLVEYLRKEGYRITSLKAEGVQGPVEIIFSIVKRKKLKRFTEIIHKFNPKAFYTIEDVKFVNSQYLENIDSNNPIERCRNFFSTTIKKK